MTDAPDARLLAQFVRYRSEEAFAVLVQRHIGLVHSVALRHTANPQYAEDITQAVFIILARKAGSLGRRTVLPGWLYHTARLVAANWQRAETRRARREQEACMQSTLEESPTDALWRELSSQLDEAMAVLGAGERDALVLRYFQNKSMAEVGNLLGLAENTAQKRVGRALEKLRKFFARRGADSTAASIAETISTHSVQPVSAALAKSVTAAALAKGTAVSTSTLTLIKGALKIMAWTKAKTAIVVGAGLLLAAGTTTVVIEKAISPTVDESLWEATAENLRNAPPVLIIRPTRFSDHIMISGPGSQVINSQNRPVMNQTIAHNMDVAGLIQFAYACYSRPRLVLPAGIPTNHFDLMLTLRSHPLEMLQKAIHRKFGLTAHREIRETEVLRLQVKDPGLLALHANKPGSKRNFKSGMNFVSYSNFPIDWEAEDMSVFFSKPVVLEPGLSGNYNLTYRWENLDDRKQAVTKELAQAGLELVPTNMPIKMLVVEKAK